MGDKLSTIIVAGQEIPDRSDAKWFEMAFNLHKLLFNRPPELIVQRNIMEEPRRYALAFYKLSVTGRWDETDTLELRDFLNYAYGRRL